MTDKKDSRKDFKKVDSNSKKRKPLPKARELKNTQELNNNSGGKYYLPTAAPVC
jgi:hypothetical protein